jgi:hypothetical protein
VEVVCEPTVRVVTGNVAVLPPGATVTLDGTVAAAVLLLASVTTAPPEGGLGPFSITVAVGLDKVPPCTVLVFSPSDATPCGTTVSVTF